MYRLTAAELGASGGEVVMATLLPLLLEPYAPSAVWIGAVIAAEGIFAMLLPYAVGTLSDALPAGAARRFGRRGTFLLAAAPAMAATLAAAPFLDGFWPLATTAFVFFAALHAFLTVLFALVIESVRREERGRVQGVFGAMRAGGIAYALVGGGLLFALWPAAPFLIAGALVLATTLVTCRAAPPRRRSAPGPDRGAATRGPRGGADGAGEPGERAFWGELVHRPAIRWFLVGNSLWSGAVDGLRPYVFLYAAAVLGLETGESALLLVFLLVGVGAGSVLAGRFGDRYGRGRVLMGGTLLLGVALGFGFVVRSVPAAIALLLPAGLGASAQAALPYAVFTDLVDGAALGRYTGVYRFSVGAGRLAAPLLIGVAIDWGSAVLPAQQGYPFMWPVAAAFALLGAAALRRADRLSPGELV